jgi:hypothetical protein
MEPKSMLVGAIVSPAGRGIVLVVVVLVLVVVCSLGIVEVVELVVVGRCGSVVVVVLLGRAGIVEVVVVVESPGVVELVVVDTTGIVEVVGLGVVLVVVDDVGMVIGLLGHSPSSVGARRRNPLASFRTILLSGPKSTWYVSPPPRITRRMQPLVPGFGGTTAIVPASPLAFDLMRKAPLLAPASRTRRTGPFTPLESL